MQRYFTIDANVTGSYKEKGSKFLSFAIPLCSEEEVKEVMDGIRKKYHDARHHCYAFRIGTGQQTERAHDDGEPSHSAGQPIMGQIHSFNLTNILVVVVRYFGGILLGVGGLMHAYKSAAKDCLKNAKLKEIIEEGIFELRFQYPDMHMVMRLLKEENARIIRQVTDTVCTIVAAVPANHRESFLQRAGNFSLPDFSLFEKTGD